ncbi:23S rRNA (pseudouridine(1915)-N(3))-methyltransferase RlmH [Eubacteriales bacterium OttesenSCG-928-K08]|nr:23S rRNA (pseudouridine(1915)-N(3))-methyltransferase RlmH [Eubacteriales bacterium OttesenSCG-928-K08]
MQMLIACVGKLKENYWRDAAAEYQKRLSRFAQLEIKEVRDQPAPERLSPAQREQVLLLEGAGLLAGISPRDFVVALCLEGQAHASEAFASELNGWLTQAQGRIVFVIGGSLGLSAEVLRRADAKISLSKMTFPHQLARVLLLEQLYRAFKINANESYHK